MKTKEKNWRFVVRKLGYMLFCLLSCMIFVIGVLAIIFVDWVEVSNYVSEFVGRVWPFVAGGIIIVLMVGAIVLLAMRSHALNERIKKLSNIKRANSEAAAYISSLQKECNARAQRIEALTNEISAQRHALFLKDERITKLEKVLADRTLADASKAEAKEAKQEDSKVSDPKNDDPIFGHHDVD